MKKRVFRGLVVLPAALCVINITTAIAMAASGNLSSPVAAGVVDGHINDAVSTAPEFKSGDRVCFIGDSITDIGLYYSYLRLFYCTRFPERIIQYLPAGHSGGTAADCLKRLDWDILARSPNIATVNFGMNDLSGTYGAPIVSADEVDKKINERLMSVQASYEKLLDALTASGVRLVLVGPSIYDDTVRLKNVPVERSNRAIVLWTKRIHEIAIRRQLGFVDLCGEMNRVNARVQAVDSGATIVGKDRVHPGEPGNLVMLYSFLKAQGVGPYVARISIDAATGALNDSLNCTIEHVERLKRRVSFSCVEKALPFPTPDNAQKALGWLPFTRELNLEMLVVDNLAAGKYELQIDDAVVGQYDELELSTGVNLALNTKTPQYQQSQEILKLNAQLHGLERHLRYLPFLRHARRDSQLGFDWNDALAVEKYLHAEIQRLKPDNYFCRIANAYLRDVAGKTDVIKRQVDLLVGEIDARRAPKAHEFKIVPVN